MQRRTGWGAVAHVFVAVALALPLAVAAGATVAALLLPQQTMLNRGLLTLLGLTFLAVVVWVALLPEVRSVEVATARSLLGLDLPDVTDPTDWPSRRRGAVWLALLTAVGLVVAVGVLYLLPSGVGLVAHPFTGADQVAVPGGALRTGSGWRASWVVLPGLVALSATGGLVWGAGALIARWAPRVIGPTVVERVAVAAERERELARANALARELHDSLGHRLTAMTVQATAARRLLRTDPERAERAIAAVEDLGRGAQADVDAVVGVLRGGAARRQVGEERTTDVVTSLRPLLGEHPEPVRLTAPPRLDLPGPVTDTLCRVAREALTNALRHGTGPVDLRLEQRDGEVVLEVRNPVARTADGAGRAATGRRGLQGLRERVLLDGGSLSAGMVEEGAWLLRATVPTE